ncbi:MAG: hypothetical protein ACK418_07680 [Pseudomonas sp.]|uniref:hypothetical protein n=1 Tax=Pseudomonas sp. TaxID=306 RepID=UPI003919FFF5
MKLSTLMLASLMTLGSAAAFAEGGAERSKAFYQAFAFTQQQLHDNAEQTASADGKTFKRDINDQEQPKS